MNGKGDDTLPLTGITGSPEELSVDVSADEDFIPTTQPESSDGSRTSKILDSKYNKPLEEMKSSLHNPDSNTECSPSQETIIDQTVEQDKSLDFIPDTETKKTEIRDTTEDVSSKKKLLDAEDNFKDEANTLWDADMSKISESPALDTQSFSIVMDTPTKMPSSKEESFVKREESISEILVNDSSETVDLEHTPVEVKKSQGVVVEENLEVSCSLNSNAEQYEETQIFDYSSVMLLDHQDSEKSEKSSEKLNGLSPEKSYLQENENDNLQNVEGNSSTVAELPKQGTKESVCGLNGNLAPKKEIPSISTVAEQNNPSTIIRRIEFKLSVSCEVTINTKTNKVLRKGILEVEEIPRDPPKSAILDPASDSVTDKSKRHSTSSSGSVYSDKTGLPFALHKRVSAISDQTDSSEEELNLFLKKERRLLDRMPWTNEYLLALKMDDLMQVAIENPELLKRPNITSSPGKPKSRRGGRVNHLKEILESSSSERTSTPILEISESQPARTNRSEESLEREETDNSTQDEKKESGENEEGNAQNENGISAKGVRCCDKEEKTAGEEHESEPQDPVKEMVHVEGGMLEKNSPVALCEGLSVLARWTDKRYYTGVLSGGTKNDRWEVKFDDGALKTVREDFIIPAECLKAGALVFALTGDKYSSGRIVGVKEGDEIRYVVELDEEKKEVTVKRSDLRMTDDMAGIVREKYKSACTPRPGSGIEFDNVLSGKRLRDQKTPLKQRDTPEVAGSGSKRKSSSRAAKNVTRGLEQINETPQNGTGRGMRGLKSENGHLVEDKIKSADSPSGNETGGTPLRVTSRELRRLAKPRSLSYTEEPPPGKKISKSYLRADGTPVPGTSGVKFRKRKIVSATDKLESPDAAETVPSGVKRSSRKNLTPSKGSQSEEKIRTGGRAKRKLEESAEDSAQKSARKNGRSTSRRKAKN